MERISSLLKVTVGGWQTWAQDSLTLGPLHSITSSVGSGSHFGMCILELG